MLKFYGDESGIHGNARIMIVAGMVGTESAWGAFDRQWSDALGFAHPTFHATALEGGHDEFYGMDVIRRGGLLNRLARVIADSELRIIVSGLVVHHFNALSACDREQITCGNPDKPYFLCLQHCFVDACHSADGLPPSERVSFLFERQDHFKAGAEAAFELFRVDERWPNKDRMGDIAFSHRADIPGIQAADLLAHESFKHLDNRLFHSEIEPAWKRRETASILQKKYEQDTPRYFDEGGLRDLLEAVRSGRTVHGIVNPVP
ncbi:MAG: DUF3800 domain-containing protein [Blastocatellia bacterium]